MKKSILVLGLAVAGGAWANLNLAPPDFNISEGRAVFIDMTNAYHKVTFNNVAKTATAVSEIEFENTKEGMPIFDLKPTPTEVKIDGVVVSQKEISFPGGVSKVRVALKKLAPGKHRLSVVNPIKDNIDYHADGNISAAFWIRDLSDRMFWEQYLPVNLEFDQHARTLEFNISGKKRKAIEQRIFANGKVTQLSDSSWKIEYPAWFTVSCPYFHTTYKGKFGVKYSTLTSVSGRDIQVTTYSKNLSEAIRFSDEAKRIFDELEADYGPWPHEAFVAYGAGSGGMEHAGATMAEFGALDHEMLHNYFAKAVMPISGNAGWIDEGIARWRDRGYPRSSSLASPSANLAGRSVYARNTDNRAYNVGSNLFAYLDYLMQNKGGMKAFLRGYFQTYKYTLISTEHFRNNMEFFSGLDLGDIFRRHVYSDPSKSKASALMGDEIMAEDPMHPKLTVKQLRDLL